MVPLTAGDTLRARGTATRFAVGLDVGTSAVKATVLSSTGRVETFASSTYSTSTPERGAVEQDPDSWWRGVAEVLDQLVASFPSLGAGNAVLALTGQMHTTVLRDEAGGLLRHAIVWSDSRASEQCRELAAASDRWLPLTGHLPIPAFTSAHLAWVRRHEPDLFARVHTVSVPKDDVRRRLGAGWLTDPSDGSAMHLLNTRTDDWADELTALVGITRDQLPPVLPSGALGGEVRALPTMRHDGSRLLGIPVIAGAGDQAAQAVALGVLTEGAVGLSVGTSGVAFQATTSPRAGAFRHALPDTWLALQSTHAAGLALAWWSALSGTSYADVVVAAHDGTPGPMFLPYLQGGRLEAGAPGTLTDLHATHGVPEISAAVVEGVALEIVRLATRVTGGRIPREVIGMGGRAGRTGALQAPVAAGLERPVHYSPRGSAHGAALLAARTDGWPVESASAGDGGILVEPDPRLVAGLHRRRHRYDELVGQLA